MSALPAVIAVQNLMFVNRYLREMNNIKEKQQPRHCCTEHKGFVPAFRYTTWKDCGPYFELHINVQDLESLEVQVDIEQRKLLLKAVILVTKYVKPVRDIQRTQIPLPAHDDLDIPGMITHIDNDTILVKIYKNNYEPPKPAKPPPRKNVRCVIQ